MIRRSTKSIARGPRRGVILVQLAVALTLLMTVLAVTVDLGFLIVERRHAQATADAAALAAAADLYEYWSTNNGSDPNGTADSSALGVASANGYTNNATTSKVKVNIPPLAGNFIGQAGYAEVIVTWYQKRGFSSILGTGTLPVSARAVARGAVAANTAGSFILLSPTGEGLSITGNATSPGIQVSGAIDINSTASNSMALTGNLTLAAANYNLAAAARGYTTSGNITMTGTVNNSQSAVADPLGSLAAPSPSSLTTRSSSATQITGNQTVTLQPGVYVGGISMTGNITATLQPGIYYMEGGGFSATGNINITGAGVMIYNAPSTSSDVISLTGNTVLNLSPMTTGTYAGLTIFQSRTSTAPVSLVGNSGSSITGTIYAAAAAVDITGNSNTDIGSQFISSTLDIIGNTAFKVGGPEATVASTREVGIVE
jgi:Putative Flp pilus-assembly TadE/G-like